METRGNIDRVVFDAEAGVLRVEGWAAAPDGAPIGGFVLEYGGRRIERVDVANRIPSPDVQAALPDLPGSDRARFELRARVDGAVGEAHERVPVTVTPIVGGREGRPLHGRHVPGLDEAEVRWFRDHYGWAARQVVEFLSADGVTLTGRQVGDVGCGDGIIDLGVAHLAEPGRLVGFDVVRTDVERLRRLALEHGATRPPPPSLEFRVCGPRVLPADDASFDVIFSWSAFEHIADPVAVLREIRRVLKPDGTVMLQLWPFFHSRHGSHLWPWFPDGFTHLSHDTDELEAAVRDAPGPEPSNAERMLGEYRRLNRITLDDVQRALLVAGLIVTKLEIVTEVTRIPREVAHLPLSQLAISGMKLLAVPRP